MKERNSSIEILRIVSMILIVVFHYHARNYNLYVVDALRPEDSDFIYKLLTHSLGGLGVPIFVFISGWFGIKYRNERLADMLFQCAFYACLASFLYAAFYHGLDVKGIVFFVNHWWFMAAYLCLYVIAPAINAMIENTTMKHSLMVVLLFYFISFGDLVVKAANIGGLYMMLTMYLSARWLKLYASDFLNKYALHLLMACLVIRFGVVGLVFYVSKFSLLNYVTSYVSPVSTLLAASLLVSVSKFMLYSKWVNKIAASCLSVYLLSESGFGQSFFSFLFPKNYCFISYVGGGICVFVIISLVDQIRVMIANFLFVNCNKKLCKK